MTFFLYQMEKKSPKREEPVSLPGPPAIMKKFIKLYLAASFDDVSISRKCERSFSWIWNVCNEFMNSS